MNDYLLEQKHKNLLYHYIEGSYNNWYLVFTKDWMEKYLPKDNLDIILLDTTTDIEYKFKIHASYEDNNSIFLDKNYNEIDNIYHINQYYYEDHYCSCHRKIDALINGANTDEECEGDRFLIKSILYKNIILYSEIFTLEELEEKLNEN